MKWAIDEWMIRKPLSEVVDGIYIECISYKFKKARISIGLLLPISAHPPFVPYTTLGPASSQVPSRDPTITVFYPSSVSSLGFQRLIPFDSQVSVSHFCGLFRRL